WRYGTPMQQKKLYIWACRLSFFFLCVAVSGIVTDIIKPMIGRARPVLLAREGFYGFEPFAFHARYQSLPSGHTATMFAIAFALTVLWPRGKYWFFALAMAVGLSRIMVNAHFVADVVGGATVGVLTAYALYGIFQREGWLRRP